MSTRIEQAVPEQRPRRYTDAEVQMLGEMYEAGASDNKIAEALGRSRKSVFGFRLTHDLTWLDEAGTFGACCAGHLADLAKAHDHPWPAGPEGDGRFGAILRPLASFASHASLMGSPAGLCADDSSPGRSGRVGARGHQ